ncbi:cytochrome d ubiquinol oxidase subunit II [Salinicola salarius]|uniref:cytochrome d ubiquinol oxidase subunit II n=1 Tax=Salinicola salarius TaxID=430457 RepID=UPI0023E4273C|nr:cytochrome d ubiquinol oxidase subunit II [Salinicola salarius]MDF3919281.1 cytochrome d ubiquinol oxidase subunit II [Salinicola salarius]
MDTLATVLYILIALALSLYFLLDGYTLGVGLNMPFLGHKQTREHAVHSVTPFWDANQTWLVFAVSALYGAFPGLYSAILPAFYIEIVVLLMLLFVRGIVFEFYEKFSHPERFHTLLFVAALVAAFLQGAIATQILMGQGLSDEPGHGDIWQYESALGGAVFILGYAVLGSAWLRMTLPRASTDAQSTYRLILGIVAFLVLVIWIVICLIEQPLLAARVGERGGVIAGFAAIGIVSAIAIKSFANTRAAAFSWAACSVMLLTSIVYVCVYPDLVIGSPADEGAIAPHASQLFLLVGLAIALPMIVTYTLYSYRSLLKP